MERKEIFKKWLNSELNSEDIPVLEKDPDYNKYQKILEHSSRFTKPAFDEQKHLNLIEERIKTRKPDKLRSLNIARIIKIAAILILLIASSLFIYYNTSESISTGTGEISKIKLPDGSQVRLNAESKIIYSPLRWKNERIVKLEGEAFFQVEQGSEFKVETTSGTVKVLGTSFNVRNRDRYFEVMCYEGSVLVTHAGNDIILTPSEFYKVIEESAQEGSQIYGKTPGWVHQESTFNTVPLEFVLKDIERQFGIKIEAENIDPNQLFTGSFSHSDLEMALKSISVPLGIKYRKESEYKVILYEE